MGDDLGGQDGPLFSPDALPEVLQAPRKRGSSGSCRKYSKAKIYFHSCGAIREYIPDLIEIGVDALNPVQVQAREHGQRGAEEGLRQGPLVLGRRSGPQRGHVPRHAGGRAAGGEAAHRGLRPRRRVRVRLGAQYPVRRAARRTSWRSSTRRWSTGSTEKPERTEGWETQRCMERLALCYRAIPEKKQEYIKAHREIWPEITRGLKDAGCQRDDHLPARQQPVPVRARSTTSPSSTASAPRTPPTTGGTTG